MSDNKPRYKIERIVFNELVSHFHNNPKMMAWLSDNIKARTRFHIARNYSVSGNPPKNHEWLVDIVTTDKRRLYFKKIPFRFLVKVNTPDGERE